MGCLVVFEPGLVAQNTSFWRKWKEKKVLYNVAKTLVLLQKNGKPSFEIAKDFEEDICTCNKIVEVGVMN